MGRALLEEERAGARPAAVVGPHAVAVAAGAHHGDDVALGGLRERNILAEEVVALVDVAGDGDALRRRRVCPAAHDVLEVVGVDTVVVHHVPAAVEADERRPHALLDGDHLGEQQAGLVGEELAGLDADGHAEVAEVARQDGGVGIEIEGPLAFVQRRPQAAADVDLLEGAARGDEPAHHEPGGGERLVEGRKLVVKHRVGQVEVRRVDGEAMARGARVTSATRRRS